MINNDIRQQFSTTLITDSLNAHGFTQNREILPNFPWKLHILESRIFKVNDFPAFDAPEVLMIGKVGVKPFCPAATGNNPRQPQVGYRRQRPVDSIERHIRKLLSNLPQNHRRRRVLFRAQKLLINPCPLGGDSQTRLTAFRPELHHLVVKISRFCLHRSNNLIVVAPTCQEKFQKKFFRPPPSAARGQISVP